MRQTITKRWKLSICSLAAFGLAFLLVGCGYSSAQSPGATDTTETTGTTATSTTQQASATMTPNNASVSLKLDRQTYGAEDPISITIHNGLSQTIWAADHQSSCTTISLERSSQGSWIRVGQCTQAIRTKMVSILPGADLVQRLSSMGEMDTGAGWQPGDYRAKFAYQIGASDSALTGGGTVYSQQFSIA